VRFGSSKRGDIVSRELLERPGPGNYSDETGTFGKDGKKITFGNKQGEKYNDNPGPGTYEGDNSMMKANNGSVRIGSSNRGNIVSREA
jgi:hypothetical protein